MAAEPLFETKGGMLVRARGRVQVHFGHAKIPCYRNDTGGYHGFLKIRAMKPRNQGAKKIHALWVKGDAR